MANPWDRLPNEPEWAYKAFTAYRLQGIANRNKIATYRQVWGKPTAISPPGRFSKATKDFRWEERVAAYDASLEKAGFSKQLARVEADGDIWARRMIENRENAALGAGLVLQKFVTLAKWPVSRQKIEQDGHVTIIEPVGWRDIESATRAAKLAMEIAGGCGAIKLLTAEAAGAGDGNGQPTVSVVVLPVMMAGQEQVQIIAVPADQQARIGQANGHG